MLPHEIIQEIAAAADIVTYFKMKQVSAWLNAWINTRSRRVIHLEINKVTYRAAVIIKDKVYNLSDLITNYMDNNINASVAYTLGIWVRSPWIQVKDYPPRNMIIMSLCRNTQCQILHFVNELPTEYRII